MGKTFIALYPNPSMLQTVRADLETAGFTSNEIRTVRPSDFVQHPDIGPDMLGISTGVKPEIGDYEEAVRRGHGLVAVTAELGKIEKAEAILAAHGAEDIDELARQWGVGPVPTGQLGMREQPRARVFDKMSAQAGRSRGKGGIRVFVW
ncbi:MAG: hypothetical protein MUF01_18655 [Bryobacterales bacterium]|jgi:hypothetical protein|nr:hypothetical protein [Bryobacterales bacterium]